MMKHSVFLKESKDRTPELKDVFEALTLVDANAQQEQPLEIVTDTGLPDWDGLLGPDEEVVEDPDTQPATIPESNSECEPHSGHESRQSEDGVEADPLRFRLSYKRPVEHSDHKEDALP